MTPVVVNRWLALELSLDLQTPRIRTKDDRSVPILLGQFPGKNGLDPTPDQFGEMDTVPYPPKNPRNPQTPDRLMVF